MVYKLSHFYKKNKIFFHKPRKQDIIPLLLPKLKINDYEITWAESVKFLDVLSDKNSTWNLHIKYMENNIFKEY